MKSHRFPQVLALFGLALALAGCRNESASLVFTGPEHALTLVARQAYPWSKAMELEVVMARQPDCQRRSRMDGVAPAELKVDVSRPPEGVYAEPILILKQGSAYYAISRQNCEMQRFKAPPEEAGQLLGSFAMQDGRLKYVPAPPAPAATPAPAAEPRKQP
jgi:hypothetical protein